MTSLRCLFSEADKKRQILNITGFRKALKKFDKITGVRYNHPVRPSISLNPWGLDSVARCVHEGKGQSFLTVRRVIDWLPSQVDPCVFASDQVVQRLLREMEDQFTARFGGAFLKTALAGLLMMLHTAKGDRKRALDHLRAGSSSKTHHFSTFRTGLALGLALPALVDGIVRSKFSNIPRCSLNVF